MNEIALLQPVPAEQQLMTMQGNLATANWQLPTHKICICQVRRAAMDILILLAIIYLAKQLFA